MGSLPIKIHSHILVVEQMEGRKKAGMEEVEKIKEESKATLWYVISKFFQFSLSYPIEMAHRCNWC